MHIFGSDKFWKHKCWPKVRHFVAKNRVPRRKWQVAVVSDILNYIDESRMFGIVQPIRVARPLGRLLGTRQTTCINSNGDKLVRLISRTQRTRQGTKDDSRRRENRENQKKPCRGRVSAHTYISCNMVRFKWCGLRRSYLLRMESVVMCVTMMRVKNAFIEVKWYSHETLEIGGKCHEMNMCPIFITSDERAY